MLTKKIYSPWFLVLLWLAVHIGLTLVYGHRHFYDAMVYLREADFFVTTGTLEDADHVFYFTHIGVISFFRYLFPEEIFPVIIFQCIVSGVAVLALYRASITLFSNHLAAFLTGLIFLLWWDNIHWNITLMTESLACSLACFLIYGLANFQGRRKDIILIFVLLVLGFFTRPTGVIPIVGSVIFMLVYYWQRFESVIGLRPFLILIFIAAGILAADQLFLRWDFTEQYVQGNIVTYMNSVEGTSLYEPSLRLEVGEQTTLPSATRPLVKMVSFMYHNPVHFLQAGILKLYYLMSGTRPYYSIAHNAFTLVLVSIVYCLFFFGWRQLKHTAFRFFVLTVILVNCFLVFISTVDWDNRFYIRMEPVIVLVAGRGGAFLMEKWKKLYPFEMLLQWVKARETKKS